MNKKKGLCPACQSWHEVAKRPFIPEDERDFFGEFSPESEFLLVEHRVNGETGVVCEGTDTVPQVVRDAR